MGIAGIRIVRAGGERIGDLESLYATLHRHHTAVAPSLGGMAPRSVGEAWVRRRAQYETWLATPGAFILLAEREGKPVGYVVVSLSDGYQGWSSGERVADARELVVEPRERGRGVGTALLDEVERELGAIDVAELRLNVIASNTSALRFYSARGMKPITYVLLSRLDEQIVSERKSLCLILDPADFAIRRLTAANVPPAWQQDHGTGLITSIAGELALVYTDEAAPSTGDPDVERGWRALRFTQLGALVVAEMPATLAAVLENAGVEAVRISAFGTHLVLVRDDDLGVAIDSLQAAGHVVSDGRSARLT